MLEPRPIVYIVDDDEPARKSLEFLLGSVGLDTRGFAGAQEFLDGYTPNRPACLLLDLRLPSMGGLELQDHMRQRGIEIPTIMITAYPEVPVAVRAMKAGAIDFVEKPFSDHALLERILVAVERASQAHAVRSERAALAARLARLTPRERDVMGLVVTGQPNKQIAIRLQVSEKTVEVHRAHVMHKLAVGNLAELVRLAQAVGA